MKKSRMHRFISKLAIALVLTREVSAQVTTPAPAHAHGQVAESNRFARPLAEREWLRGYGIGHEQGFWAGVRDRRAGLPPIRFMTPPPNVRLTPLHHGHLVGFIEGYRRGFFYW